MSTPGPYEVLLHPETTKDLRSIPRNMAERIVRALEERLAVDPFRCGERLRQSLQGFWKMRVGDYRVVYEVARREVRVYGVMHRREVYTRILGRSRRGWAPPDREGGPV